MRRRIRKISTQIFLAQLAILTVATGIGFGLLAVSIRHNLDEEYQSRAAAIANAVAEVPTIRRCMATSSAACASTLQELTLSTAKRAGATYIVLIDTHRIRHTHPDPALIGQKVEEPLVARDGKVHLDVNDGSTGPSANARVPLYGLSGAFEGEVSVGIPEASVTSELAKQLPSYAIWFAVMFGVGTGASFLFASILKRRTFGLEIDELAQLLQEREATLHGIREGVVAVDPNGVFSVVNGEARRLLGLPEECVGRRVIDVVPPGRVRDVLIDPTPLKDWILITSDYWLVVNRRSARLQNRPHGIVITVQDRTALEGLTRELDGARSFTDSLRAQQHEFSNRLHAIAGLLELGRASDALEYLNEIRGSDANLDQSLRLRIACPPIVGLMLGKAAEAAERGIELVIDPATRLGPAPDRVQTLITVLGNLVDNAFDALAGVASPRRVTVRIVESTAATEIVVSDNGPGIAAGISEQIFTRGFTTKRGTLVRQTGLGLSLVHDAVARAGGSITVSQGPGATFTVTVPSSTTLDARSDASPSTAGAST
ncbi:sensor histidine kinase [Curtobacterium ammoniigenes]|uniref:sensor histidine kinase n=1 Tax=Curtobacterium ammoniigenes TaxID=395387 RepID=UPI000A754694|nr:sensor histidine kinase [Curtobacterium ammoniigenes]